MKRNCWEGGRGKGEEHMIPYSGSDKGQIYSLGIVGSSG
jgi:hypothetical protein